MWRAGRSCAACRCCEGFCARCLGVFSLLQLGRPCVRLAAIVSAFCGVVFRPTRRLPLLRPACAAPPGPACRLSAVRRGRRIFAAFSREAHGKLFPFLQVFRCFVPGLRASLSAAVVAAFVYGAPAFFCRYAAALFPACGLSDTSALGLVCAAAACHALVRAFFLLSFAFFRLTFASQISFHLSLRPRRASTFFRKESRQRFAKGLRPFEPHSCALRPFFPSSALLAGLRGLSGRKPPADGETLEKPRSKAQLFKRFCAKEDACTLSPISPFLSLLAGLHGPSGRKPPAGMGNARKAKEQSSAFRAFLCVGDAPGLSPCHKGQ